MNTRPAKKRWWLPALALLGGIWWAGGSGGLPTPLHPLDWLVHLLAYIALAYSLGRATGRPRLALVLTVWWGAGNEVHQAFVPGREAGIGDWWFDFVGAMIGTRLCRTRPLTAQLERHTLELPQDRIEFEDVA